MSCFLRGTVPHPSPGLNTASDLCVAGLVRSHKGGHNQRRARRWTPTTSQHSEERGLVRDGLVQLLAGEEDPGHAHELSGRQPQGGWSDASLRSS